MISIKFRSIKSQIRILAIDDGKFVPQSKGTVNIIGVVYRGALLFEGMMQTTITIDGLDVTKKIVTMIKNSPYYKELRVILLDGITMGGFNVVDIFELFNLLDLPVISVVRKKPDLYRIKKALKNLPNFDKRWQVIENAGELFEIKTRNGENPVYVQTAGISLENVVEIMKKTSLISNIPEPLRVAHIIASGLSSIKRKDLIE